ncbi:MAG: response regulator [Actinomycetota bacterium]|nr:response regulator [Actinomycetota bacterium]
MSGSILVVDDDAVVRSMLSRLLEQRDHDVTTAKDGREALDLLRTETFDVVLLDVLMPLVDGFQVLEQMKGDPKLRHIPVVMVTALDDVESAARCIEMGGDDYLPKPIDPVVLGARINAGLNKKRLRDLEARHVEEVDRLNRRLEARVEDQMAELVRTGELKRFMPQQVAEGLLAGQLPASEGFERRKLTLLFADMVGFTDLSDTLEPEELSDVLNEYLREMTSIAVAHDGTLDNYIGDGLMVIFGAPRRSEERAQAWSAIRAAFAMKQRMNELAASVRGRGIPADLQIRVGVNTGHCTVGVFGSDIMRAYKAVGFPVNVAARLQTEAEPGTVLCGFRTYALVKDRVRAEAKEPLMVKGAARPVEAWHVHELLGDVEEQAASDGGA